MSVLELERGSAGTITISNVLDGNGNPVDLTTAGIEIRFYFKHKDNISLPDDTSYIFRKANANVGWGGAGQILVTSAITADVYVASVDTINLEVLSYAYRYRVHILLPGQDTYIINSDKFRLLP